MEKIIKAKDNSESSSRCYQYIGVPIIGTDNTFLEGEVTLQDGTECHFHNGFLDGNIYDDNENIIEKRPALIYENGGFEYWEKGIPKGKPAVIQNFGLYEEDWFDGKLSEIRITTMSEILEETE